MNIAIRVDSSTEIGSGHVMRCLTLAEGLREKGAAVHFICKKLPGNLSGFIEGKRFSIHYTEHKGNEVCLPDHLVLLKAQQNADARLTSSILKKIGPVDWLIVDNYALDEEWERAVASLTKRLFVIDDLADRRHYCDLLLDQNINRDNDVRYKSLVPFQCRLMLGPSYALLRPEFTQARKQLRKRRSTVHRLLIFFGGTDTTNETEKTLKAIQQCGVSGLQADVVVGASNRHADRIKELCASIPGFEFHRQVSMMSKLMTDADCAIGAGGTTTWERCCLGLPSFVVTVAQNQERITEIMAEKGFVLYLGKSSEVTVQHITDALKFGLDNPYLLESMSTRSLSLVDGHGTDRVVRTLSGSGIMVRRATVEDCKAIFHWRNNPETRKFFFDARELTFDTHMDWCRDAVSSADRVLLIGTSGNEDIGVIRFDLVDNRAAVSVYIDPAKRGQGLGPGLITAGSEWLFGAFPNITNIEADVMEGNTPSMRAFAAAGYFPYYHKFQRTRNMR